jgi:hypothetical protein
MDKAIRDKYVFIDPKNEYVVSAMYGQMYNDKPWHKDISYHRTFIDAEEEVVKHEINNADTIDLMNIIYRVKKK